jgi:hypothetical protein
VDPSPLRFDAADFGHRADASFDCAFCNLSIDDEYYEVNGQSACPSCRDGFAEMGLQGTPLGRFTRALLLGGIGGLVGAGIYYAVLALSGYEIGLVAIVVGFLVGIGVRAGSGGVGGRAYQVLAVALTYIAIVSTYIPFIVEELRSQVEQTEGAEASSGEPSEVVTNEADALSAEEPLDEGGGSIAWLFVGLAFLLLLAMATPFLAGLENVIGILIIGFALYEAWRINARRILEIEGPFRLAPKPRES